ncbi:MAG: M23 family metallopeptidase [Alistipes sp.]|nr:M23 family metallopeptidase [Alistipes sp.]
MAQNIWSRLTEKQQLIMRDKESGGEQWRLNISPLAFWGSIVAFIVIVFATLLLLMAYTSLLDTLPGYRTKAERLNDELTESIMRLDAMERNISDILAYNEAVAQIMGGSTPTLHSTVMTDTIRYDKSRILPTRADSLLRDALERTTGEYSLSNTKPLKAEAAMFSTPLRGSITRQFDAPESSYDLAIISIDGDDSVMAVENGTVISIDDIVEGKYCVMIQHTGGYISVYKGLGEILVRKGQTVQSGSVIGRLRGANSNGTESNGELIFELWRDGTAVDPERYILF